MFDNTLKYVNDVQRKTGKTPIWSFQLLGPFPDESGNTHLSPGKNSNNLEISCMIFPLDIIEESLNLYVRQSSAYTVL